MLTPPGVVLVGLPHLVPGFWPACPPLVGWDRLAAFAIVGLLGGVALAGLAINVTRLVLVERLLRACPPLLDPALEAKVAELAGQLRLRQVPSLRLLAANQRGGGMHGHDQADRYRYLHVLRLPVPER